MVVWNRTASGGWSASSTGQSASSLGYGSSSSSKSSSSSNKSTSSTSSGGSAAGAHNTSLSSGIANHTTLTNGQPNTAKTSTTTPSSSTSTSSSSSSSSSSSKSNPYAGTVSIGGGSGISVSQPSSSSSTSSSNAQSLVNALDSAASTGKADTSSLTWTSPSSGGSGGGSLSSNTNTSTVQPVFVSGASENNTYRIIEETGSYQIAASGISLADAAQYYAEKGDTKAAGDFAAAANYETASNIRATYGVTGGDLEKGHTDLSYDATYSLTLDPLTGKTYLDPSSVIEYAGGNGLLGSSPAKTYYEPMTVSRTLGGSLADSAGTSGAGDPSDVVLGNQLKSTVNLDEVMSRGSDLVNNIGNLPDILASNGTIAGAIGSFAATMLLPTDLVKVIKKISDGNTDEITGYDIGYAIADALSFVPFLAPLKILKSAAKVPKIAGYASGALTLGTSGVDTVLNPSDGDNDKAAANAKLLSDALDTGDGSKLTWMNPISENPTKADTPTQNPDTPQTLPTPQPEQLGEYDMSGITDMLAALFAQKTSGAGGGSGVTLVTNEAQPVDYSGVFRYIIPAIVIIGIIIVASKLLGNKKKGGSAA